MGGGTARLASALPPSRPIRRISPSSFEILRACRLRAAYAQELHGVGLRAPALRLGSAAHRVLDDLVASRALLADDWRDQAERRWDQEIKRESAESEEAGERARWGEPERWPGFEVKRARLLRLVGRLRELVSALPAAAELLTEVPLEAYEGQLYGVADLVIRGDAHAIVDYKTGGVIERDSGEIRASYARQLPTLRRARGGDGGDVAPIGPSAPARGATRRGEDRPRRVRTTGARGTGAPSCLQRRGPG